jgi:hypothetical protein
MKKEKVWRQAKINLIRNLERTIMRLNEFASGDSGGGVDHAHSLMRYKKIMCDKGVAEATGDEEFDTMLSKITSPTAVNAQNREDTVNELIRTYFWHKRRADLGPEKTHEHGHEKIVLKILKKLNRMGIDLAKVDPVKLKMIKSQVYEQSVAEDTPNKSQSVSPKINIQSHRVGNTMWIDYFEVKPRNQGFGTKAYMQWEKNLPSDIKTVRLVASDAGEGPSHEFWDRIGFDYAYDDDDGPIEMVKTVESQGVTEDTQSEDIDQITRDFVQHYENDPMGVFMHAKSSYLDAVGKAKHFSRKAAALYKSHANMSKQEFQDTVMKYFGKHLQNNGFPPHASEGWGKAEHELVKDLMNLDNQGVTEGEIVKGTFGQKFKPNLGRTVQTSPYEHRPDIDIPQYDPVRKTNWIKGISKENNKEPYDYFKLDQTKSNIAHIIGVTKDGLQVKISTSNLKLAEILVDLYNRGGFTDADIEKIQMKSPEREKPKFKLVKSDDIEEDTTSPSEKVEAYGYVYNNRDQRIVWRKIFSSEDEANRWADRRNATVLGIKPLKPSDKISETSAGSVATVVNPKMKDRSKVGTLFGGTYKQRKDK